MSGLELLVEVDGVLLQLGDVRIAVDGVHAAGGVPGRAAGELAALDQQHVLPAGLGQVIEDADAHHAAADHHHLRTTLHMLFLPSYSFDTASCTGELAGARAPAEALDQPGAKQRDRRIRQSFRVRGQVVAVAVIERRRRRASPGARRAISSANRFGSTQRDALAAERVLRGQHRGVEHQAALDVDRRRAPCVRTNCDQVWWRGRSAMRTCTISFASMKAARSLPRCAARDVRMAQDRQAHRPQQVA